MSGEEAQPEWVTVSASKQRKPGAARVPFRDGDAGFGPHDDCRQHQYPQEPRRQRQRDPQPQQYHQQQCYDGDAGGSGGRADGQGLRGQGAGIDGGRRSRGRGSLGARVDRHTTQTHEHTHVRATPTHDQTRVRMSPAHTPLSSLSPSLSSPPPPRPPMSPSTHTRTPHAHIHVMSRGSGGAQVRSVEGQSWKAAAHTRAHTTRIVQHGMHTETGQECDGVDDRSARGYPESTGFTLDDFPSLVLPAEAPPPARPSWPPPPPSSTHSEPQRPTRADTGASTHTHTHTSGPSASPLPTYAHKQTHTESAHSVQGKRGRREVSLFEIMIAQKKPVCAAAGGGGGGGGGRDVRGGGGGSITGRLTHPTHRSTTMSVKGRGVPDTQTRAEGRRGKERVGPKKVKLTSLKKKIFMERLQQYTRRTLDSTQPAADTQTHTKSLAQLNPANASGGAAAAEQSSRDPSAIEGGGGGGDDDGSSGDAHTRVQTDDATDTICIHDFVAAEQLEDDDEVEEVIANVTDLCSGFGQVSNVVVLRTGPLESVGMVMVQFNSSSDAYNAVLVLAGKVVQGEELHVTLYPREKAPVPGPYGHDTHAHTDAQACVVCIHGFADAEILEDDDEYEELLQDARALCAPHGTVLSVYIPRSTSACSDHTTQNHADTCVSPNTDTHTPLATHADMDTDMCVGNAYIGMATHTEAVHTAHMLSGRVVQGQRLRVTVCDAEGQTHVGDSNTQTHVGGAHTHTCVCEADTDTMLCADGARTHVCLGDPHAHVSEGDADVPVCNADVSESRQGGLGGAAGAAGAATGCGGGAEDDHVGGGGSGAGGGSTDKDTEKRYKFPDKYTHAATAPKLVRHHRLTHTHTPHGHTHTLTQPVSAGTPGNDGCVESVSNGADGGGASDNDGEGGDCPACGDPSIGERPVHTETDTSGVSMSVSTVLSECTHVSEELNEKLKALFKSLFAFQERARAKDSVKAKKARRLVLGLREVTRSVKAGKTKLVVIAPDLECSNAVGQMLAEITEACRDKDIPCVCALNGRRIARALGKGVKVHFVGVLSADGAMTEFNEVCRCLQQEQGQRRRIPGAGDVAVCSNVGPNAVIGGSGSKQESEKDLGRTGSAGGYGVESTDCDGTAK